MIHKKTVMVEKEINDNVSCDFCGESCSVEIGNDESGQEIKNHNYAKISSEFGYGSERFDGLQLELHMCEKCFDNVTKKYNINLEERGTVSYW